MDRETGSPFEAISKVNWTRVHKESVESTFNNAFPVCIRAVVRAAPLYFAYAPKDTARYLQAISEWSDERDDDITLSGLSGVAFGKVKVLRRESPEERDAWYRKQSLIGLFDSLSTLLRLLSKNKQIGAGKSLQVAFQKAAYALYFGILMTPDAYTDDQWRERICDELRLAVAFAADLFPLGGFKELILPDSDDSSDLWYLGEPFYWKSWALHFPDQMVYVQRVLENIAIHKSVLDGAVLPAKETSCSEAITIVRDILQEFETRR